MRVGLPSFHRLAVVVALAVLASVVTAVPAAAQSGPFDDVRDDAYYSIPVSELDAAGVFDGTARSSFVCPNGFCPDDSIDRKTVAVWVVRVVEGQDPPSGPSGFDDVDQYLPAFWSPFVGRLAALGITRGCGDGSRFCPNQSTTRAEMAAFLSRAFDLSDGPDPGFSDVPGDAWYAADVARLKASKITVGCGDGTRFCPNRTVSRAEMATFLHRAIAHSQSEEAIIVPLGVRFVAGWVRWNPVPEASSYDVRVCTNEGCLTHREIDCCDWRFGNGHFNSIRVRTVNSTGKSDWSTRVEGPEEQAPTTPMSVQFSSGRPIWNPAPGATTYELEWLWRDTSTIFQDLTCSTRCTLGTDLEEGEIRVRAGNEIGWSPWSDWVDIPVEDDAPSHVDTATLEEKARTAAREAERVARDVNDSVKVALQATTTQAFSADQLAHWIYEAIDGTSSTEPPIRHARMTSIFVAEKTREIQALTGKVIYHPSANSGAGVSFGGSLGYVQEREEIARRMSQLAGTDRARDSHNRARIAVQRTEKTVELARALRVWAEWSELQAGLACTDFLKYKAGEIVDLTTLGLLALSLATGVAKIVIFGLKALAVAVLDKLAELSIQQILDKILSPPYDEYVDTFIFLSPPNPADDIGDTHVTFQCTRASVS